MEEYEATLVEIRGRLEEMESIARSLGGIYHTTGVNIRSRIETVRTLVNRLEAEIDNAVEEHLEQITVDRRKEG